MEPINYMKLEIPALIENTQFARSAVSGFATCLNPTIEEMNDIKTAISEAFTNCVIHAYEGNDLGIITITARIYIDRIEVIICDNGKGIADIEKAKQPFFTTGDKDERSGMGFTMISALMNTLDVDSKLDIGTTLVMSKVIMAEDSDVSA